MHAQFCVEFVVGQQMKLKFCVTGQRNEKILSSQIAAIRYKQSHLENATALERRQVLLCFCHSYKMLHLREARVINA